MQVWIVGQSKTPDGRVWELGGVYSTAELARADCTEPGDSYWVSDGG